jgi:hypothetical protein
MQTTETMRPAPTPTVGAAGTTVVLGDNIELTLEQAGNLGRALLQLCDELTPAGEEGLRVLSVALETINETQGTTYTPASVAGSLGIDLATATEADVKRLSRHVGGVLMR